MVGVMKAQSSSEEGEGQDPGSVSRYVGASTRIAEIAAGGNKPTLFSGSAWAHAAPVRQAVGVEITFRQQVNWTFQPPGSREFQNQRA